MSCCGESGSSFPSFQSAKERLFGLVFFFKVCFPVAAPPPILYWQHQRSRALHPKSLTHNTAPGAWEDAGCWHEPRCHRCDKQRWWSDAALAQQSPENIFMNFHPLNASLKTAFHQLPSRNNELKMSSAAAAQPGELCLILLPSPPGAPASPRLHMRRGDAILLALGCSWEAWDRNVHSLE